MPAATLPTTDWNDLVVFEPAELCRYHQRLRDIFAQYEGGRLPDAAYHKAEILNDEINQRFSPMMRLERERAMPGLGLAEQPWQQAR
jgi:hypothetical protein